MSNEDYKPNLDGMVTPEQAEAAEKSMVEAGRPSLLAKLNPLNWPRKVQAAALVAALTAAGLGPVAITFITSLLFGG